MRHAARLAALLGLVAAPLASAGAEPDFSRQIRPLLAGRCFKCHGPDEAAREAGLRLDVRMGALAERDGGGPAVVPGDASAGSLLERVTSSDPDMRMPPPSEGDALTPREIDLLRQWIAAGANYSVHWSYVAPQRPTPPAAGPAGWGAGAIDRFVGAVHRSEGLSPQPEADRATLLRRVALDLTGLPPSLDAADEFLADASPDAYERAVDRLLASPAFGERWGRMWLDLARYADTSGYADDPPRTIWRYRDWVIDALNADMPFDQFTIEQLAGDLLPDPTDAQRLATAFHRNTMTNNEGGTDDEEYRNVAIVDRVNTTMQVWMGTTIMCAQCHTHKYDPITQHEYYGLFDIFNQSEDADRPDESPVLPTYTADTLAARRAIEDQIAAAEQELQAVAVQEAPPPPPEGPVVAQFVRVELPGKDKILSLAEVQVFRGGENIARGKPARQSSVDYNGPPEFAADGVTDGTFDVHSTTHTRQEESPWWEVDLGAEGAIERISLWNRTDGAGIGARLNGARLVLLDAQRKPRFVFTLTEAPATEGVYTPPASSAEYAPADREAISAYLAANSPAQNALRERIAQLRQQRDALAPTTTPVMRQLAADARRTTHVQIRGNFLDKGDQVFAGVPAAFPPSAPNPDRLALAQWLVDRRNPLTARVLVNRLWEQLFAIGIVETSEEFGMQGELPSHPELLDWLAVEAVDSGWNLKHLIRLIVTSATYRQSSSAPAELLARDPNNRLLARGPRFRLEAELVRDQALAASGLLSDKLYGPSVKPPRPRLGLTSAFGGSTDWEPSAGEDRWRRGLYTYWQRSVPYPSMDTFDAPSREVCTVRRSRTNTPLQALVTLNDPVYVEAAQGLARRVHAELPGRADDQQLVTQRLDRMFRLCLTRRPTDAELSRLREALAAARERFAMAPDQALLLATDPIGPLPEGIGAVDLAGWTVVGNVLLNLDESLSRR